MYTVNKKGEEVNVATSGYAGILKNAPQKILEKLYEETKTFGTAFRQYITKGKAPKADANGGK